MKIVKDKIAIPELKEMARKMHDNLVKAMVDIEKEIKLCRVKEILEKEKANGNLSM